VKEEAVRVRLLLAMVTVLVTTVVMAGQGLAAPQAPSKRCAKGQMHAIYKGVHKCLGLALRKRIYWELAHYQDTHPGQDKHAYYVIAARFRIPVRAVQLIAVEGATKSWPLPPLP
jgi:hypothetical protein